MWCDCEYFSRFGVISLAGRPAESAAAAGSDFGFNEIHWIAITFKWFQCNIEELWMLKQFLWIRKKRDLLRAELFDYLAWYIQLLQKCDICRCNIQDDSATISNANAPLLLHIAASMNTWMNSDKNLLERSNQNNLQSHKSRFVKYQIAGTISRWRKQIGLTQLPSKQTTKQEIAALVL